MKLDEIINDKEKFKIEDKSMNETLENNFTLKDFTEKYSLLKDESVC